MTAQPGDRPHVDTRTMTWLYILALSMVAALTLAGQLVVQLSLSALQHDTTTVNDAGRQRMLSQRIPRLTLDLAALDAAAHEANLRVDEAALSKARSQRTELRELLSLWNANHDMLSRGGRSSMPPGTNSASVAALFVEIDPHVVKLTELVESALERDSTPVRPLLSSSERAEIIGHSDAFLLVMDEVVSQLTVESRQRVARLRWIERALLLATLIVLACEGCFIFSPAVASLSRALQHRQRMTEQLELAKDTAESASRAKTDFLARVSHELRTPLHAVLGMLSLVRRGRLSQIQRRRIELATRGARTLRRLVDDLLDIAGAEAGRPLQLQPSAVDVARVIDDCMRLMQPLAHRKRLSISTAVDLPPARFVLDEFRLRQILMNLLQNSIRYTDAGSIECSCDLEEQGSQQWLRIAVRDTGRGIAPEHHQRIFETFVRLDASQQATIGDRRLGVGLGLGLPITASLVTSMGGSMTLESQADSGSIFKIVLPAVTAASDPSGESGAISSLDPGRESQDETEFSVVRHVLPQSRRSRLESKLRALIVDDAPINRILMKQYFKELHIPAVAVPDLARAWEVVQQHQPNWIFLDAHLPEEDPIEFIRRVRQSPELVQPTIIIVTADVQFSMHALPADALADDVLHKPLSIEQLQAALRGPASPLSELDAPRLDSRDSSVSDESFAGLRHKLKALLRTRLPEELASLRQAVVEHDAATIVLTAHRLRGAAANAGWTELAVMCARLEAAAEDDVARRNVFSDLERLASESAP